jgi:hypothetical protein
MVSWFMDLIRETPRHVFASLGSPWPYLAAVGILGAILEFRRHQRRTGRRP